MKKTLTSKEVLDFLEKNELSQAEHLRLLGILNKDFNMFPLANVITVTTEGAILANGNKLSVEEVVKFRQGVSSLRDNWAFQLLGDQILFDSIKHGIHYGDTLDKMMFSKTAIYFIQKFREYISTYDVK